MLAGAGFPPAAMWELPGIAPGALHRPTRGVHVIHAIYMYLLPFCSRRRLCSSWRWLQSASLLHFVTSTGFIDTNHLPFHPQQWGFVMFFGTGLAEGSVCRTAAGKAVAGLGAGNGFAVFSPFEGPFSGGWGSSWGVAGGDSPSNAVGYCPKPRWDFCVFSMFGTQLGSGAWTQPQSAPG